MTKNVVQTKRQNRFLKNMGFIDGGDRVIPPLLLNNISKKDQDTLIEQSATLINL